VVVQARPAEAVRDQDERVAPRERLDVPPRASSRVPDLDRKRSIPATRVDRLGGRDADGALSGARRIARALRAGPECEHDESGQDAATHALVLLSLVHAIQPRSIRDWEHELR